MPVRRHLTLLALLILIPQVLVGAYVAYLYAADTRSAVERSSDSLVESIQHYADREITSVLGVLRGLSTSPSLRHDDLAAFYEQAALAVKSGDLRGIAVRNDRGEHLLNTNAAWGAPLPTPNAMSLALDRKMFETGKGGVSDLHTGLVSRAPLILVGAPLTSESGVKYSLSAALTPDVFGAIISSLRLPDGWLGVVIDGGGHIVARSRNPAEYVGGSASQNFLSRATGDAGRVVSTTLDGVAVSTTYRRSPVSGWTYVVSVPRPLIEAPSTALWRSLVALGALGLVTSSLAGAVYTRAIGGSLRKLAAAATGVGASEPPPATRSGIAEIDEVHRALAIASAELSSRAQRQSMLMAELDHRVKNMLAVIQSLVGLTMKGSSRPDLVADVLRGRVMALARAHEALSEAKWGTVEFSQLVHAVTTGAGLKVDAEGPSVRLAPKAVVALAQALHELAADAVQHRVPAVALNWSAEGDELGFRWRENRIVDAQQLRSGFGWVIISLCIVRQLGGVVELESDEHGFVVSAAIPFDSPVLGRMAGDRDSDHAKLAPGVSFRP